MKAKSSAQVMKAYNQQRVLNVIYYEGPISRIDIAAKTGLTQQTITNITGRLLEENIIIEGKSTGSGAGRKPIPLEINHSQLYAIGIEITVQSIRGILVDFNHNILAEQSIDAANYNNADDTLHYLQSIIDALLTNASSLQLIKGIGISIQGVVDPLAGIVINSHALHLKDYPLKEKLEQHYSFPVHIDNDINTIAIVENSGGALDSSQNNLTLSIDEGIGGAIVINKELYTGYHHRAGEFGHIKTFFGKDALPCHCGSAGCLTTMASIGGLENVFSISIDNMIKEIMKGNQRYENALLKIGNAIGDGLCNLIIFFDPEKVLLTGRLFDMAGDFIIPIIKEKMKTSVPHFSRDVILEYLSKRQEQASMAAELAIQEMFKL
ncbi:ROK family transcriptional regulator [Oceanobacillus chungangensis]|uniref:ROK family transcriptional regulator n=1 Tax=Oceanobacillus chungangensis TaxID=1229152 RepID=UPI0011C03FE5|nr:ROK family transcriptional regulator [Oceanobacillus chungangensis]